jgi:hypothetical protein
VDDEFIEYQTKIKDVEESKKIGENNNFCPYYYSHLVKTIQDMLICPYDYLLS